MFFFGLFALGLGHEGRGLEALVLVFGWFVGLWGLRSLVLGAWCLWVFMGWLWGVYGLGWDGWIGMAWHGMAWRYTLLSGCLLCIIRWGVVGGREVC